MTNVLVSDTTLRDGLQQCFVNVNVSQRLGILEVLEKLGLHYIELGWPGTSPATDQFFEEVCKRHSASSSQFKAFGSTRRAWLLPAEDDFLPRVVYSKMPVVTLFGKTSPKHVELALGCTLGENLNMIRDSVRWAADQGKEVIFDAEHGCDAGKEDLGYLKACLDAAVEGGATILVLCDTRGNNMPWDVASLVEEMVNRYPQLTVGAHMHNDLGLAVANTLAAVRAGARYVETAFNGYGERTGNADSVCVIADLQIKLGYEVLPESSLEQLNKAAERISELTGVPLAANMPWSGSAAWSHKAGCHSSAVLKHPELYEHTPPETVGAKRLLVMSEQLGQAVVRHKAEELGLPPLSTKEAQLVVEQFKNLGLEGGDLENANGTVELLMRRTLSGLPDYFKVRQWRSVTGENLTTVEEADSNESAASLVVECEDGVRCTEFRLQGGPVAALDGALRKCLLRNNPRLADLAFADFVVQIKGAPAGVQSTVVASVRWLYQGEELRTMGVSQNMMAACLKALTDAYNLVLYRGASSSIQDECLGVGA